MLVNLNAVFDYAKKNNCAIGAFNAVSLESLNAIISAAEELDYPVILNHAQLHEPVTHLDDIVPIMLLYAKRAKVPVCVHLDHGEDYEYTMRAIRLGATSVMYDASRKPYETNIAETAEIVKVAHAMDITVEAELGRMLYGEGNIDIDQKKNLSPEDCYTNPDDAKDFLDRTNVDCLAISFGTAHGIYAAEPKLNLDIIKKVSEATNGLPLVMHGGSGVSDQGFRDAISNGIRKINYYTYMALAGAKVVDKLSAKFGDKLMFHEIADAATKAMKANVMQAMTVFMNK